jgi:hypothetical protein
MGNEDLLYIEDDKKRKLFYRFTPAALVSNFVPLIVILDENATHFEYKMWNVLTPLDHFGYENKGSCWLGGKGDFFVKDLLQELIQQIAEEYECEDHIYLYGSDMGGYGAILHGMLCKANAVYAHAPRIRIQKTSDGDTFIKENDLTHFLNATDPFPVFYLCENENDPEDETVYFADACKKHDIKVHLDFCPKSEDETPVIKEVLGFFERMASEG